MEEGGSYLKYLTAASNMRMLYSPGTFLYRPEPMRSLWPILPKTRPSGDVMPSMAYREPFLPLVIGKDYSATRIYLTNMDWNFLPIGIR